MGRVRKQIVRSLACAALVALAASPACAGFMHVDSVLGFPRGDALADCGLLLEVAGCTEWSGAAGATGATQLPSEPSSPDEPPRIESVLDGPLPYSRGDCQSAGSVHSCGGVFTSAGILSATASPPEIPLVTRLPMEIDPTFTNPPPWAPLKPPRVGR